MIEFEKRRRFDLGSLSLSPKTILKALPQRLSFNLDAENTLLLYLNNNKDLDQSWALKKWYTHKISQATPVSAHHPYYCR